LAAPPIQVDIDIVGLYRGPAADKLAADERGSIVGRAGGGGPVYQRCTQVYGDDFADPVAHIAGLVGGRKVEQVDAGVGGGEGLGGGRAAVEGVALTVYLDLDGVGGDAGVLFGRAPGGNYNELGKKRRKEMLVGFSIRCCLFVAAWVETSQADTAKPARRVGWREVNLGLYLFE
jgi:hypothetical protein